MTNQKPTCESSMHLQLGLENKTHAQLQLGKMQTRLHVEDGVATGTKMVTLRPLD